MSQVVNRRKVKRYMVRRRLECGRMCKHRSWRPFPNGIRFVVTIPEHRPAPSARYAQIPPDPRQSLVRAVRIFVDGANSIL
jgi:hypothetical protein